MSIKINKFKNFKFALKNTKIDMLTIATKPEIQNNVLNFIYDEKILPKFIFLEKPLLNKTLKIIKKFPKKSHILTNFIFSFDRRWKYFQKKINSFKSNCTFEYNWFFKQAYFENKNQTWKTDSTHGGGLIYYYLPYAIFKYFILILQYLYPFSKTFSDQQLQYFFL